MSPGARASVRRWTTLPAQLAVRARLFILHGTHEHCGKPCYAELAAACNAVGIEAFSLDFHGHGRNADGARGDFGSLDDAIADAVEMIVAESGRDGDDVPVILFGHSLGSMVCFLLAHQLATTPSLPTPACVVLSGFAMDSVSPPFGVQSLTPVLRALPSVVRAVCALLATLAPTGPACPLPPPEALMNDPERARLTAADPLQYQGWIQNRTAIALLDGRARCNALLAEWGAGGFPFLLIHGGQDALCPRSACDALLAAAPQRDKTLRVYDASRHEVLNDVPARRQRATQDVVAWLDERVPKPRPGAAGPPQVVGHHEAHLPHGQEHPPTTLRSKL